jgi:hypothetical protein
MNLLPIAALLIVCGVTVTATDKSKMVQDSGSKPTAQQDNVPKSIADSISGPLQFVEGSFLGVAETMPENKYSYIPTAGNFDGVRSCWAFQSLLSSQTTTGSL